MSRGDYKMITIKINEINKISFINIIDILIDLFPYLSFVNFDKQYHILTASPSTLPERALRFLFDYLERDEKSQELPEFWKESGDPDLLFRYC